MTTEVLDISRFIDSRYINRVKNQVSLSEFETWSAQNIDYKANKVNKV